MQPLGKHDSDRIFRPERMGKPSQRRVGQGKVEAAHVQRFACLFPGGVGDDEMNYAKPVTAAANECGRIS